MKMRTTWSWVLAVVAIGAIMASLWMPQVRAGDMTPMVQSSATRGAVVAADAADNVKIPGTLEVDGTSTLTGAVTATAGVTGDLTGDVTGDVTGNVTGDVTGEVNGVTLSAVSEAIAVADFTDNTDTTGYVDLTDPIPAGALVLGWTFVGTGAFAGDTTATMQVGIAGGLDAFSAKTDGSVFTAATVGSAAVAATAFCPTATTARVTVTGTADFTSIVTDGNGAGTVTVWYIAPGS